MPSLISTQRRLFSLAGAESLERVRQENADAQNAKKCRYGIDHWESPC
jgi:hypothetical protein